MSFIIKDIKKSYAKKSILKGISFEVPFGTCIGILGINGSGKSTLLSILSGVQKQNSGEFLYEGKNLLTDHKQRSKLIGYVPQGTPLIEELCAKDNLLLWYTNKTLEYELESGVLSILGIKDFLRKPVYTLSGGMKKRLSIGCSMSGHPKLLLLDEPSAAIDFVCKKNISDYITAFKNSGGSVVIATHDITELSLCDKVYILKDGRLLPYDYDGNIDRLAEALI